MNGQGHLRDLPPGINNGNEVPASHGNVQQPPQPAEVMGQHEFNNGLNMPEINGQLEEHRINNVVPAAPPGRVEVELHLVGNMWINRFIHRLRNTDPRILLRVLQAEPQNIFQRIAINMFRFRNMAPVSCLHVIVPFRINQSSEGLDAAIHVTMFPAAPRRVELHLIPVRGQNVPERLDRIRESLENTFPRIHVFFLGAEPEDIFERIGLIMVTFQNMVMNPRIRLHVVVALPANEPSEGIDADDGIRYLGRPVILHEPSNQELQRFRERYRFTVAPASQRPQPAEANDDHNNGSALTSLIANLTISRLWQPNVNEPNNSESGDSSTTGSAAPGTSSGTQNGH